MRKKLMMILFLAVIISPFLLSGCNSTSGPVNLSGIVRDYNTNNPIKGVQVSISGNSTDTNEFGEYRFTNIYTSGSTKITATKDGYWNEEKNVYFYSSDKTVDLYMRKKDEYSGTVKGNVSIAGTTAGISSARESLPLRSTLDTEEEVTEQDSSSLNENGPEYVPGEVLVQFESGVDVQELNTKESDVQIAASKSGRFHLAQAKEGQTTEELVEYYRKKDSVKTVSKNRIGYLAQDYPDPIEPDDPYFEDDSQWYLWDIYAPEAWAVTKGSSNVTVAVIDTGYLPHEDLDANLVEGYDFVDDDEEPIDKNADENGQISHGNHMAGLIGAAGNNDRGIAGVNWDVSIMPLRIFQEDGGFNEADLIDAIYHAIDNGADIINLSLFFLPSQGTSDADFESLSDALQEAKEAGITVVAAAGNEGENFSYYPGSSDYTISAAASNLAQELDSESNAGDLMAPGYGGIISTDGGKNSYSSLEGTSVSAALISGAAALLTFDGITGLEDITTALDDSSDNDTGTGIINIYDAFETVNVYEEMKVMAVIEEDTGYRLESEIKSPDSIGDYQIDRVKTGSEIKIIGWLDTDNDEKISSGDYFGESSSLTLSADKTRDNIDFSVSYISETSALSEKEYPEIILENQ